MDRNRRERTSPATNNQKFHLAGATNFPCERAVLLPADKIPFVLIRSSFLRSFAQHIFGLRYRRSSRTISRCSRAHHEGALFDAETHDKFRQRAEHAIRLPTVPHSREPRAIFEPASRRLRDEHTQSISIRKLLRVTYQENPASPD